MRDKLAACGCPSRIGHRLDSLPGATKDLVLIAVLALLPVLFLANVLFTDQVLVSPAQAWDLPWRAFSREELLNPHVHKRIDPPYYYYPQRAIAATMVENGDLPLWNPYYLAGVPFLATEPWAGFFYPPNLIYYLADPLEAFGYSMCLHLILAGVFMYFYLRSIHLDRLSSLFGGIAFELTGFFLANLMWPVRVVVTIWAPLTLLSFERYWNERRWYWAMLLAFAVGMSILAGYVTILMYMALGLSLYCVLIFIRAVAQEGIKKTLKPTAVVVAAVATGVLVSAIQVIPTLEAIPFIRRLDRPYDARLGAGIPPSRLATAIVPDIFGNRVDTDRPTWDEYEFGRRVGSNYSRGSVYAGMIPLAFALSAVALRRNKYTVFFGVLALLSLSVVLDVPSVTFRILYTIPVFRIGRQLEFKAIYALAISVLAAQGFRSLVQIDGRKSMIRKASWTLLSAGGLVVLGVASGAAIDGLGGLQTGDSLQQWFRYCIPHFSLFGLMMMFCGGLLLLRSRGKIGPRLCGSLLVIVVVTDLFCFGWRANTTQRAGDLYFATPAIEFLQADRDISRIIRAPDGDRILRANSPSVYGIYDAQGYAPTVLEHYAEFMRLVARARVPVRRVPGLRAADAISSSLLDLLNVKYILAPPERNAEMDQLEQADADISLVYDGEIKIYEKADVLARAFVVHDFKVLPDGEQIFAELTGDEFDPAAYVILEEEPATDSSGVDASLINSSTRILDYTPNKVVIEADVGSDGFLILSDLYYPGWKALVDGANQKVYKADYIFRAVQLTEGHHTVEFVYDPLSFKVGLGVSASTLGLMGLLTVCLAWRKWRLRERTVHGGATGGRGLSGQR